MSEKKTITAHCLVRNEENFVGFALRSVLPFVDKAIVFDTGSTDGTVQVIRAVVAEYPDRIIFEEKGECDKTRHTKLRQEMLERTETDWFMIVDGDEVWTERGMKEALEAINSKPGINCLASQYYLCVGDVYHTYYKEKMDYFFQRIGFFTTRFIRRDPDIEYRGDYENDTLFVKGGGQYFRPSDTVLKQRYWHVTHLNRSSSDAQVFTSGLSKRREDKRRLTYFLIGRKIVEPIPEIFSTAGLQPLSASQSFLNFLLLLCRRPEMVWRRLLAVFNE